MSSVKLRYLYIRNVILGLESHSETIAPKYKLSRGSPPPSPVVQAQPGVQGRVPGGGDVGGPGGVPTEGASGAGERARY